MGLRRVSTLSLCAAFVIALAPIAPASAVGGFVQSTSALSNDYIVILKDSASVGAKVNKETSLGNEVRDVFSSKVKGFVAELDPTDVRRLKQDPQVLIVELDSVMSVIDTQEPSTTSSSTTSSSTTSSSTSTTLPASTDDLAIGDPIPFEYIVTLRDGVSATAFAAAQADGGAEILGTVSSAINGFAARLDKVQLSLLASDPNVSLIEENTVVGITGDQANPPSWGLDRIDQRTATLDQNYSYNFTGAGVNAYVIDTGVRSDHRDFAGRVVAGSTQVSDGRGTEDCNGHGTHVAGTIGGQTYGVAKAVRIVPIRVLSCRGSGSMFNVISGVNWMIEHHLAGVPAVANLSLGGGRNTAMNQAVANAVLDGITMVVAAGNNNRDSSGYSPASEPSAVTVGATMSNDGRASYSNFGAGLDIFAPGSAITSTYYRSSTDLRSLSGTSMAAPHVAGAVALLLEESPTLTPAQVVTELSSYSTPDVVMNAGSGSVNRLLFTRARWTPPAPEAPSSPRSLVVVAGVAEAALSWVAPTQSGTGSLTDYLVEYSANNGSTWATFADGVTTATTASVTGLTNGTTYSFRVSAVNATGTSPATDVVRAVIGVPTSPTALSATAGAAQVALRWTAPSQNGGSEITDYVVSFSSDLGDTWSTFDDGVSTALTATVTGLTNGASYLFRVGALNAIGAGAVSSSVSAVPWQVYVPSAPRDLIITSVMVTSIALEWRIPTADGGGFIMGYVVEQSSDSGVTWSTSLVTSTGGRAGGIWFTTAYDLVSAREYRFRVRATNAAGNSEPSTTTAAQAPGIPSAPEDVRAVEARPRSIVLRWERPLSTGGSAVRGYTIEYSTDSGTTWTTWPQNTGVEGCVCQYMARTVTELTDGLAHIFRVTAYNSLGAGPASDATDSLTPLTPVAPDQPTNVVGSASPALVDLDWDGPTQDGGAPITDYIVEYSTNAGVTWATFADGTSTATLASLRGLSAGIAHIFRVSAVNSAGRGAPSSASSAVTPLAPLVNDAFSGATSIITCGVDCPSGTSVRVTSATRSATRETGEPSHGGYGASASIWYSFSIGRAGTVTINTSGSDFDTLLGVYTGSAVEALTTVIANDDVAGGNWSQVTVVPVVNTTYWVAIDGYGGRKGATVLNWSFTEAPPAQKPGVPRSVRAVAGNAQATVYWSAPESDGGAAITGYTTTSFPGGQACATVGALTCVVTGLTNGTAYTFTVSATNSAGTSNSSAASDAVTPRAETNDGVVSLSWGLDRIDQRALPLDTRYTSTRSGAGVTVYVVDTGVRATHSELSGRVAPGFSFISDENASNDCHGHGTHVAGTIAGTNYGVAPAALIVPVRVMNCSGSGTTSGIIAGVDWIITHHQAGVPAVANLSIGGPRSAALDLAVARGVADGVTFVVAAGNANVSACTVSPAGEPTAITVGSTTSSDERSSFSNFGSCLDVFAPGSNIVSAGHLSDSATRTMSGTSMAAPHVAGVAALALSQNNSLTPSEVASAIASSATRNVVSNPGAGSLNRLAFSLLTPAPNAEADTPTTTSTTVPSGGDGGGGGGGGGGGDDDPTTTTTSTTTTSTTTTTVPTTQARTAVTLPRSLATLRLLSGIVVLRPPVPQVGEWPLAGTPAPILPAGTPELAVSIRSSNGILRIFTEVAKGSVLHIYKGGELLKSLAAQDIADFELSTKGIDIKSLHIVVVLPSGEVAATAEPIAWMTTTTVPPATTTVPPATTTVPVKNAATPATPKAKAKAKAKAAASKAALRSTNDKAKN